MLNALKKELYMAFSSRFIFNSNYYQLVIFKEQKENLHFHNSQKKLFSFCIFQFKPLPKLLRKR